MPAMFARLSVVAFVLVAAATAASGDARTIRDCAGCPPLIAIAPGSFEMGAQPDDDAADEGEFPLHAVSIARGFAIGRAPVTVGEYAAFVEATGYATQRGCYALTQIGWKMDPAANWRRPGFAQSDDHPVVCVSWEDAEAYVGWLSLRSGRRYRLPSETEWEYAARGGTDGINFWGDDAGATCLYGNVNDLTAKNKVAKAAEPCTDGFLFTAPAGHFRPNPFGLHDVIGNAWQWVADCWLGDYRQTPRDGEAAEADPCEERVMRGSSWTDTPGPVRVGAREHGGAGARLAITGFRVARDLD